MADNSCNILEKKAITQEAGEAIVDCQFQTILKKSDQNGVDSVGSSSYQPVDENVKSLRKSETGSIPNQETGGSTSTSSNEILTDALKGNVEILKCGLKIDVIDDTAVIETGIGGENGGGFVGFADYPQSKEQKKNMKQETIGMSVNSCWNMRKGLRNCSRTSENHNVCEKKSDGYRKVYRRRLVNVEEQRKKSVHYGPRKCSRTNGIGKALTHKIDGQNVCHKNYPKKNLEKIQSASSVKENANSKKTAIHGGRKCSRTIQNEKAFTRKVEDENEYVCEKKCDRVKRIYTGEEMVALRFVGLEEQSKMWAEIFYCRLAPAVMKEYNGLVDTSCLKHIQLNFKPRSSILGSFAEPSQNNIVN